MKTSVERLEGDSVKLTVTVPAEQIDREVTSSYAKYAEKVKIPGFRPGKAPRTMLDRYVGKDSILADAHERLLNSVYPLAIEQEGLFPVDQPDLGEVDMISEGEDYTFEATITVRPRYELEDLSGLTVAVDPAEPSESEIDAQVDYLRDRFASLEPVQDRGVEGSDFVQISFQGSIDGEGYEGDKVDKLLYEMGRLQMPIEFERAMLGAKAGEQVHAEFVIQAGPDNEQYVGKTAAFDVTIHEIKAKVLPEADDQFATQAAGFDTIEEMRQDLRVKAIETKQTARVRDIERMAREALGERLKTEPPVEMVDAYCADMTRDFFENLSRRGVSMDDYVAATGVSPEQIETDIGQEARSRVKQDLALEALFMREGLEVTEDDLRQQVDRLAGASGRTADDEMFEALRKAGLMVDLRLEVVRRKAVRWLMEHVEVIDKQAEDADDAEDAEDADDASAGNKKKVRKRKARAGVEDEATAEGDPAGEQVSAPKEGE